MKLAFPPLFSDGMVIQRDSPIPLRAYAQPGSRIAVTFMGNTASALADREGSWEAELPPAPAGGPYTMEIRAPEAEPVLINDVWIGDVWLCAGQSNMELPMERLKDEYPEEWNPQINSGIRQFKVPQEWDFGGPRGEYRRGCWQAAAPETLAAFPGTAWFFARALYEKYRLPIGLISTAMGGTPVEAWMSADALKGFPQKAERGRRFAGADYRQTILEKNLARLKAWYETAQGEDAGLREKWYLPETGDSDWEELSLPGSFANSPADGKANGKADGRAGGSIQEDFCGVIWFRKTLRLSAAFAGKKARLWLGTIVDADTVYVNGREIGGVTYRYPPRKYSLPAGLLKEGENHICIRVLCCRGGGQITPGKPFRVFNDSEALELAGAWKYKTGFPASPCPEPFFIQREPAGLYNAMIAPALRHPMKGIIWYQGEINADTDEGTRDYAACFTALINDWREKSGRGDLPFLFVQLPLFGTPGENTEKSRWALIREAQAAALSLPATGMATALDLGEWNDLHPLNKKDVGGRLALAALAVAYGEKNSAPGPLFRGVRREGDRLILGFDNRGAGLVAKEAVYVTVFAGGKAFRLRALIKGKDSLAVDVSGIPNPAKILYAWADNPADRGLYNADDLPAPPFRALLR
jgi:sialate O-acetylesterase